VQLQASEQQFTYARRTGNDAVIVAFNNDAKPAAWDVDLAVLGARDGAVWRDRLGNTAELTTRNRSISIALPARSAAILALAPGTSPR
jgi:hypothetical protein